VEPGEPLLEKSPFLRFLGPWFRSRSAGLATLAFLAVAGAGFLLARAGEVNLRYAAMNPVRDAAVLEAVVAGTLPPDEAVRFRAPGSAVAAETLYLPPLPVLRVLSLGWQPALADLLFVRAQAYFVSHFFADRQFRWLDLDPDNPRVYQWAGQVAKLGQNVDDDVIRRSNRFLEAGVARHPRDWRLHLDLGFNLNFELVGRNDAERTAARLKARDHFAAAAGIPGAPVDPNFVAALFERGHENELAMSYALQKYYESTGEQRAQLLRRIGAISGALADGIKDEEDRWREDYPFLPVALFALVTDRGHAGVVPAAKGTP
jgi:hypothetical protein